MKILFYWQDAEQQRESLIHGIRRELPDLGPEIQSTIEELEWNLKKPKEDDQVIVLAVHDQRGLRELVSMRELFQNIPLILLTPDYKKETMKLAHQLRPRFLGNVEGDLESVIDVLKRIVERRSEG